MGVEAEIPLTNQLMYPSATTTWAAAGTTASLRPSHLHQTWIDSPLALSWGQTCTYGFHLNSLHYIHKPYKKDVSWCYFSKHPVVKTSIWCTKSHSYRDDMQICSTHLFELKLLLQTLVLLCFHTQFCFFQNFMRTSSLAHMYFNTDISE
jgi:hypothetical protein